MSPCRATARRRPHPALAHQSVPIHIVRDHVAVNRCHRRTRALGDGIDRNRASRALLVPSAAVGSCIGVKDCRVAFSMNRQVTLAEGVTKRKSPPGPLRPARPVRPDYGWTWDSVSVAGCRSLPRDFRVRSTSRPRATATSVATRIVQALPTPEAAFDGRSLNLRNVAVDGHRGEPRRARFLGQCLRLSFLVRTEHDRAPRSSPPQDPTSTRRPFCRV